QLLGLDYSSNAFSQLYAPSAFNYTGSGSSPCAFFPKSQETLCDGAPASRHTYAGLVSVARRHALYSFNGNLPSGTVSGTTWVYDTSLSPSAANWVQKTSRPAGTWNVFVCDDDAARDRAVCVSGPGQLQEI